MYLVEEMFGPDNTMDRFTGCIPDGTPWEGFLVRFRLAFVALSYSLNIQSIIYIVHLTDKYNILLVVHMFRFTL